MDATQLKRRVDGRREMHGQSQCRGVAMVAMHTTSFFIMFNRLLINELIRMF